MLGLSWGRWWHPGGGCVAGAPQVPASPPQRRSSGLSALQEGRDGVSKTAGSAHARRPPEPVPAASPVNRSCLSAAHGAAECSAHRSAGPRDPSAVGGTWFAPASVAARPWVGACASQQTSRLLEAWPCADGLVSPRAALGVVMSRVQKEDAPKRRASSRVLIATTRRAASGPRSLLRRQNSPSQAPEPRGGAVGRPHGESGFC